MDNCHFLVAQRPNRLPAFEMFSLFTVWQVWPIRCSCLDPWLWKGEHRAIKKVFITTVPAALRTLSCSKHLKEVFYPEFLDHWPFYESVFPASIISQLLHVILRNSLAAKVNQGHLLYLTGNKLTQRKNSWETMLTEFSVNVLINKK